MCAGGLLTRLGTVSACCPSGLAEFARQGIVLFCFLQPAAFCALYVLHRSGGGDRHSSTILHNVELNASSLCYFHVNGSACAPGAATVAAVHAVQIDFLFLVLPFSLLVSATSMLWVNCIGKGALRVDTVWDSELADAVFVYETVYYVELWCMNVAVVAVACSERSMLEVHYAAMVLTLLLVHVCAQARVHAEYSTAEHVAATLSTLVFAVALAPLWLWMVQVRGCLSLCCPPACLARAATSRVRCAPHAFCVPVRPKGHRCAAHSFCVLRRAGAERWGPAGATIFRLDGLPSEQARREGRAREVYLHELTLEPHRPRAPRRSRSPACTRASCSRSRCSTRWRAARPLPGRSWSCASPAPSR